MANNKIKEYVEKWMKTYEPDTFIPNKHNQYIYRSENLASGINLVSFFEDLLEDYIENECAGKTSNENGALPIPDVSQQREQLRAFVDWYNLNRQKNETMIEYYDIRRYLEALNCG